MKFHGNKTITNQCFPYIASGIAHLHISRCPRKLIPSFSPDVENLQSWNPVLSIYFTLIFEAQTRDVIVHRRMRIRSMLSTTHRTINSRRLESKSPLGNFSLLTHHEILPPFDRVAWQVEGF